VTAALTFAVVLPTLYAAHQVGDYWVQTHHQALTKGKPRSEGQLACLRHVATYTATTALFTGLVWLLFDLDVTWLGFLLGQAVSAGTHYWADRRAPLLKLAGLLDRSTGKLTFAALGTPRPGHDDNPTLGTGAAALDQSWHILWLFAAALITALI
jgi:hypothetical protein